MSGRECYYYDLNVLEDFTTLVTRFRQCGVTIAPAYKIESLRAARNFSLAVLSYKRVKYDPLTIIEAKSCLESLLKKVSTAMNRMHQCGIAHNDVCLPNVCFNTEFKAVFTDVDRATLLEDRYADNVAGMGCMYDNISGDSLMVDMVQLGWMVAWIVSPG